MTAAGGLQMDPAYAKEYGIPTGPPPPHPSGATGLEQHQQPGGDHAVHKVPGGDSDDDDDDEDLYAEPTYQLRSRESGQQGAQALERAQREAGSSPPPPMSTVPAERKEEGVSERERERETRDGNDRDDADEPVVMQAASYPGMEWTPRWDGTIE